MKSPEIPFFGGATSAAESALDGVKTRTGKGQGAEFATFLAQAPNGKGKPADQGGLSLGDEQGPTGALPALINGSSQLDELSEIVEQSGVAQQRHQSSRAQRRPGTGQGGLNPSHHQLHSEQGEKGEGEVRVKEGASQRQGSVQTDRRAGQSAAAQGQHTRISAQGSAEQGEQGELSGLSEQSLAPGGDGDQEGGLSVGEMTGEGLASASDELPEGQVAAAGSRAGAPFDQAAAQALRWAAAPPAQQNAPQSDRSAAPGAGKVPLEVRTAQRASSGQVPAAQVAGAQSPASPNDQLPQVEASAKVILPGTAPAAGPTPQAAAGIDGRRPNDLTGPRGRLARHRLNHQGEDELARDQAASAAGPGASASASASEKVPAGRPVAGDLAGAARTPVRQRPQGEQQEAPFDDRSAREAGSSEDAPRSRKAARQEAAAATPDAAQGDKPLAPVAAVPAPAALASANLPRTRIARGPTAAASDAGEDRLATPGQKIDGRQVVAPLHPGLLAQPHGQPGAPGKFDLHGLTAHGKARLVEALMEGVAPSGSDGSSGEPRRISQRELEFAAAAPTTATRPLELLFNGHLDGGTPEVPAPPPLPPGAAPILEQAAQDPGLAVSVLSKSAHVSIAGDDGRALELHLRMLPEGGADVRATGNMAPMVQARVHELGLALAAQGFTLGNFDLSRGDSQDPTHRDPGEGAGEEFSDRPAGTKSTTKRPSDGAVTGIRGNGRYSVKA